MSIDFLDTIRNRLPVALIDAKDVKGSILINPDPNLPASFLQGSAVLTTTDNVLTFYDSQGNPAETLDLTPANVAEIEQQIAALQSEVSGAQQSALAASNQAAEADGKATNAQSTADEAKETADGAQDRADSAHNLAVAATETAATAMAEGTAASVLSADNRVKIAEHTLRIDEHTGLITANRISAETALERVRATDIALEGTNSAVVDLSKVVEADQKTIGLLAEASDAHMEMIEKLDENVLTNNKATIENSQKIEANRLAIAAVDLDGVLQTGENIEVASITSDGSFFMDELYIPPENQEAGNFTEVKGEYAFAYGDKGKILTFDDLVMDLKGKKLTGLHTPTDSTDAVRKAELDPLSDKVNTNEQGIVSVNTEL